MSMPLDELINPRRGWGGRIASSPVRALGGDLGQNPLVQQALNATRSVRGAGAAAGAGAAGARGLGGLVSQAAQGVRGMGPGGWAKAGLRGGLAGFGANLLADPLDNSNLLGGKDSGANDAAAGALRGGAIGAGVGSVIPGVGTAVGAGVGALGGALWSLASGGDEDAAAGPEGEVARIMTELNMPESYTRDVWNQFDQTMTLAGDDPEARAAAAQAFLEGVTADAQAFIQDPTALMSEDEITRAALAGDVQLPNDVAPQTAADFQAIDLDQQARLAQFIQPYALEMTNQADAAADAMELAAAQTGDMEPFFRSQAEQHRSKAARDVITMVASMRAAPYVEALKNQASMLNQQSQQIQSQAMSAVTNGEWDLFQQWKASQSGGGGGGGDVLASLGL